MSSSPMLFDDLNQVSQNRQQAIAALSQMMDTIVQADTDSDTTSGLLGLERHLTS